MGFEGSKVDGSWWYYECDCGYVTQAVMDESGDPVTVGSACPMCGTGPLTLWRWRGIDEDFGKFLKGEIKPGPWTRVDI